MYNSAAVTTKQWKGEKLQRRDRQVAPLFRSVEIKSGDASYQLQSFIKVLRYLKILSRNDVRFDVTGKTNCKSELPTGPGEKFLKVVSSKALSDVRPNYTLFLTTTQFDSRTLAWLPWLVQVHLSLIFPCPPDPHPTPLPHQLLPLPLGS